MLLAVVWQYLRHELLLLAVAFKFLQGPLLGILCAYKLKTRVSKIQRCDSDVTIAAFPALLLVFS